MKKFLCFILSIAFVFCFAGCDSPKEDVKRITIDEFKGKLDDYIENFKVEDSDSGFDFSYSIRVLDAWEKKTILVEGTANENREIETVVMKLVVKNSKGVVSELSSDTIDYVKNVDKADWSNDLVDNGSIRGYELSGYAFITHTILLESVLFDTFKEDLIVADLIMLSETFFEHRTSSITQNHWTCKVNYEDVPTFIATFKG